MYGQKTISEANRCYQADAGSGGGGSQSQGDKNKVGDKASDEKSKVSEVHTKTQSDDAKALATRIGLKETKITHRRENQS